MLIHNDVKLLSCDNLEGRSDGQEPDHRNELPLRAPCRIPQMWSCRAEALIGPHVVVITCLDGQPQALGTLTAGTEDTAAAMIRGAWYILFGPPA